MTDIIQRMKNHVADRGGHTIDNGAWGMMLEACTEIENIRASNKELCETLSYTASIIHSMIQHGFITTDPHSQEYKTYFIPENGLKKIVDTLDNAKSTGK